ncbi:MAG: nucleotidyl transferase AbiEii/AbiGii toxin family protein [Candidatus Aminicenantes bacterium]|nr:nucleotidyl transferase AbiEii/AbiGii toxin family protein [Candidatus Aminicenantes bacterium]
MKDELLALLASKEGYNLKLNTMREYLQAYILRILFKNNFFQQAAFLGGTCLRFIHGIKRFSEDLDFSLYAGGLDFEKVIDALHGELEDSGYFVNLKVKKRVLYSVSFKFAGMLYGAGMSSREEENLSIKIELDTNPPKGAQTEKHILNRHFMFGLTCYDLPTLFAGKINAVLTRDYVKGRDFYDIFWYLTTHKNCEPNIDFLEKALRQFSWQGSLESIKDWKSLLVGKLKNIDWEAVRKEVELLIEDRDELLVFSADNLLLLLEETGGAKAEL